MLVGVAVQRADRNDIAGIEMAALLDRDAQRAGAVRADVTRDDVKALLGACMAAPDRARMSQIVAAGLRP